MTATTTPLAPDLERVRARSRAATVQKIVSPGGIEAWLVEDYAVPLVAVEFAFKGGAVAGSHEQARASPSSSPACSTRARGRSTPRAFHQALDEDAIELSFSADRDMLNGRLQTLSRNCARAFELLRLAVNEARLDAEPFARVVSQISAGLKREANDPDTVASRSFRAAAYAGHPYGLPVRGDLDDADDAGAGRSHRSAREDLRPGKSEDRRRRRDRRGDPRRPSRRRLRRPAGDAAISRPCPMRPFWAQGQRVIVDIDVPQSTIRFGRQGLAAHRSRLSFPRRSSITCSAAACFRRGSSARCAKSAASPIRSIRSSLTYDHGAMFLGGTSTKNERAAESMAVIEAEIRSLAEPGPTEEELDKAKKYLIGSYALRFDTSTKIASPAAASADRRLWRRISRRAQQPYRRGDDGRRANAPPSASSATPACS